MVDTETGKLGGGSVRVSMSWKRNSSFYFFVFWRQSYVTQAGCELMTPVPMSLLVLGFLACTIIHNVRNYVLKFFDNCIHV